MISEAAGAEGKQSASAVAYQGPRPRTRRQSSFGFGRPPRRRPLSLQAPRRENVIDPVIPAGGKRSVTIKLLSISDDGMYVSMT